MNFLDIPDDLIANCLSFLGPNTTILHVTPPAADSGCCFLMATKNLILTCKQLRQCIKSSIVIKVIQIWKLQPRNKLIVESWGDLSFYYNTTTTPSSLVGQALIQIYELYHCGYDIHSLKLRICRGDIPILQALLSKNFLPIPTNSFILLFDYKNTNPAFMFPSIEQKNYHPMARFIKQYLDDQKWINRKDSLNNTRFGLIQDVHSILNMKNNKMKTSTTTKQQLRKLQTIFVWDSTIWDENEIINFISLIKSLEVLHLTIVPEETLKRGQLNPQGKVVQQPNQHSDIEMMTIFKRILISSCFISIDDDGKKKNGYDDDDDDDDDHSTRPQFRSSSSSDGGGGGIHTLTLQSQSSLYNHVIDENLTNTTTTTTTTNIMSSSSSSASSTTLLQSNTLQQLDIVGLDQCYFAALLDAVVVCPNLQQFRYKEKEWNLLLLPPLDDDDEKQLHEKESLLPATQKQQQQAHKRGGVGGDTHQTPSSSFSLTSLSTTNDRSKTNSFDSTTTATASSSPSSSHTKKLTSQSHQQDSKSRVPTERLTTRKFEQATTISSSASTVGRVDGNTTTTRNIHPKRFTLKAPYECDMQAFL